MNSSLVEAARGYSLVSVPRLLTVAASLGAERGLWDVASLVAAPGPWSTSSIAVVRGLSCCTVACGILPDQVSNPYLFHWQADYLALNHQGSSIHKFVCGVYEIYMNINVNKHYMKCI